MQKRRIVVSLSTIPSRCDKLDETLVSLASQTLKPDAIFISVSKNSIRENKPYPVKALAKTVKRVLPGVGRVIVLDEDYGPLTKLMGPLLNEDDPTTLIITVDDDQKYGEKLVETLVKASEQTPNAAVCMCGHVVGHFPNVWGYRCSRMDRPWPMKKLYLKPGSQVDIISGWCGVLYPRGIFGDKDSIPNPAMESMRKESLKILHRHDDLYISAWLDLLKVKKYVTAYAEKQGDVQLQHAYKNSLSMGDSGPTPSQGVKHLKEFWGVVRALRSKGLLVSNLRVKWYNSTVTVVGVISTLVIATAVGILIYHFYRKAPKTSSSSIVEELL
ncbi:MAG: hypothetical protein P4L69_13485 [Desulfosporosinus sp.]|nr:hypothetical protein [Desulfosporosinus sp.]